MGEIKTFTYPDAIVRVHFADISEQENNKRLQKIKKAAEELLKSKYIRKEEKTD